MTTSILVLVGSLRAGSTNRQLAEAIVDLSAEAVAATIYEGLVDLPFYNEDIDSDTSVPASATSFRAAIEHSDAVLIVTPEYDGTLPAVIKNAIDWGSRPFGASTLAGQLKRFKVSVVTAGARIVPPLQPRRGRATRGSSQPTYLPSGAHE